jgi:hypothetical protein
MLHFRPVQEFLELPLDYEREQNTLARLLPDPLYVLFIQVKCQIVYVVDSQKNCSCSILLQCTAPPFFQNIYYLVDNKKKPCIFARLLPTLSMYSSFRSSVRLIYIVDSQKIHVSLRSLANGYSSILLLYRSFLLSENIFIMEEREYQCKVFFAYFVTDRDTY